MIGVKMGKDDGRKAGNTRVAQAAIHARRVGPGVDENTLVVARTQHDRIALTDIAHDEEPVGWWPAPATVQRDAA